MRRRILHLIPALLVAVAAASWPAVPPASAQAPRAAPGVDAVLANPGVLAGKRLGIVTHQAGITSAGALTATALARAGGLNVTALFAPEHGIDGTYDAAEPVPTVPSRTPVYSLYGATFRPTRQMLSRVDTLVVDLQDVGVRAYTYVSTMSHVMSAARDAGKDVVILDRPNPMGGTVVDGPVLQPHLRSFIGIHPISYVHGMTIGELARLFNTQYGIGADLTVIPMAKWKRAMTWAQTGLPWVNPSPGITSADAVFQYATTGPVDGTNLWNGVATESRFQVVLGDGWIDGTALAAALNGRALPGVRFSASALPHPRTFRIWSGVRVHVTDPAAFHPTTTMIHILAEIRRLHGAGLRFSRPARGPYLFDLVWGTPDVRLALARGEDARTIIARWQPGLEAFKKARAAHLLYD